MPRPQGLCHPSYRHGFRCCGFEIRQFDANIQNLSEPNGMISPFSSPKLNPYFTISQFPPPKSAFPAKFSDTKTSEKTISIYSENKIPYCKNEKHYCPDKMPYCFNGTRFFVSALPECLKAKELRPFHDRAELSTRTKNTATANRTEKKAFNCTPEAVLPRWFLLPLHGIHLP